MSEENKVITRPDVDVSDNDALLQFTLGSRLEIHAALTSNGMPPPGEVLDVVMRNLGDIERVSVGRMRIKAEEKANELNQNMQSALLAGIIRRIDEINVFEHSKPVMRTIPTMPDDMDCPVVPGQLVTIEERKEEDIESFMRKFEDS